MRSGLFCGLVFMFSYWPHALENTPLLTSGELFVLNVSNRGCLTLCFSIIDCIFYNYKSYSYMDYLDSELIILEVQKHPYLYDTRHTDYKNRDKKRDAWLAITRGEWDQMDEKTKSNIGKYSAFINYNS